MAIRNDLSQVENLISRLISIGEEFEAMDDRWSHMKNREDFDKVYLIEEQSKKHEIEEVYATGRDIAIYMSEALQRINADFTTYPNLSSIIKHFEGTWVYSDLSEIIEKAKKSHTELNLNLWSFNRMLEMFNDQLNLLTVVKQTLNLLKNSNLYKIENGVEIMSNESNQNKATISAAQITAIAIILAAIIGGVFVLNSQSQKNININSGSNSTIITGDENLINKK